MRTSHRAQHLTLMTAAVAILLILGGYPSYAQNEAATGTGQPPAVAGGNPLPFNPFSHDALVAAAKGQASTPHAVIEKISENKLRVKIPLVDESKIPDNADPAKPLALPTRIEVVDIIIDAKTSFSGLKQEDLKVGGVYFITVDKSFSAKGHGDFVALKISPSSLSAADLSKPVTLAAPRGLSKSNPVTAIP